MGVDPILSWKMFKEATVKGVFQAGLGITESEELLKFTIFQAF